MASTRRLQLPLLALILLGLVASFINIRQTRSELAEIRSLLASEGLRTPRDGPDTLSLVRDPKAALQGIVPAEEDQKYEAPKQLRTAPEVEQEQEEEDEEEEEEEVEVEAPKEDQGKGVVAEEDEQEENKWDSPAQGEDDPEPKPKEPTSKSAKQTGSSGDEDDDDEEEEEEEAVVVVKEAPKGAKEGPGAASGQLDEFSYLAAPGEPFPCPVDESKPLLVFASVVLDGKTPLDKLIVENALTVYKALEPLVKVIVFAEEESETEAKAKELGLVTSTELELNRYQVPFIRPLMVFVEKHYEAPFYGFADSSLVFGEDLLFTLQGLAKRQCEDPIGKKLLIIGKRRNLKTSLEDKIETVEGALARVKDLRALSKTFIREAVDYFIMTKGLFEWASDESFPDYVIGRPHFNNAIVLMALRTGTTVVDASTSITAVHQNDIFGEYGSDRKDLKYADRKWNLQVENPMGLTFEDFKIGHTGSAHFATDISGRKIILKGQGTTPSSYYPYKEEAGTRAEKEEDL